MRLRVIVEARLSATGGCSNRATSGRPAPPRTGPPPALQRGVAERGRRGARGGRLPAWLEQRLPAGWRSRRTDAASTDAVITVSATVATPKAANQSTSTTSAAE